MEKLIEERSVGKCSIKTKSGHECGVVWIIDQEPSNIIARIYDHDFPLMCKCGNIILKVTDRERFCELLAENKYLLQNDCEQCQRRYTIYAAYSPDDVACGEGPIKINVGCPYCDIDMINTYCPYPEKHS